MANRKVLFRSAANINEVSPSADSILISSIDQQGNLFTLKSSGTTLYSNSTGGLLTMNGDFSIVPATDDTGTIGVDPSETGGDPLSVGSQKRFHLIRGRKIKAGSTITLENSIDITNSADGVSAASTGRIKYESATQALRASENGAALDDIVLRTKAQTLTNKTFTAPSITDFTSSQHSHQNAAGGGQLDHGLALTGLADDDHAQYAILAGRAGGQLLKGGTAASENLTLQSTANATRGAVIAADQLQTTSTTVIAAFRVGSVAGDPSTLANGDIWYDSTAGKFRAREAGTSKDLISAGSSTSLQTAYDNGVTITTTASGAILFTRGAAAAVGDQALSLVDANAAAARTAALLFMSDANSGTGPTLHIQRTAGDGAALIEGSTTRTFVVRGYSVNSDTFVVDGLNGRFGFNTAVGEVTFAPQFDFHYQAQANNGNFVFDLYSNNGGENFEIIGRKARGTVGTPLGLTDDDDMFEFGAYGHNGTTFSPQAAAILFEAAGTWSGTNNGTRQVYKTTLNGATVLREVMVLGDDGSVVVTGGTNGLIGAVSGEFLRVVGNARIQGTVGAFTGTDVNPTAQLSGSSVLLGAGAASTPDTRLTRPGVSQFRMDDNASGAGILFNVVVGAVGVESADGAAFAVSGASTGRLRYNNSTGTWQYSTQGGAYASFPTGSGTANTIPKWTSGGVLGNSVLVSDAGNNTLTYSPVASTSGSPTILTVTGPAHTTLAAAEATDINFNLARTVQFTAGATIASQRAMLFRAPTYSATAATQTITDAATLAVTGAPVQGTNVTLTRTWSAWFQGGSVRFDGDIIQVAGNNDFRAAVGDANPTQRQSGASILLGAGGASALDTRFARTSASAITIDNNAGGGTFVLSAVTGSLFYESSTGAAAAVSGAATGRLIYNNTTGTWQVSTQAGAYQNVATVAVGGGTLAFVQGGNSFGATATFGTNDANAISVETGGTVRFTVLAASSAIQGNGGFTIFGGSGASETLTLNSTSNATKGKILFGASVLSGYVETTDSWGFGTVSPAVQWDFFQAAASATLGHLRVRDSTSLLFEADLQNRKVNIYGASATAITDGILNVSSTTPLAILKGNAGGDYSTTLRFAGEATDDWLGGYVQYDATGNELIIGTHNTADKLVASDIEGIRFVRATGSIVPGVDAGRDFGSSALRWTTVVANAHSVFGAASDANPTAQLLTGALTMGAGGATAVDLRISRSAVSTLRIDNNAAGAATILGGADNTLTIGTAASRLVDVVSVTHRVFAAASDANASASLLSGGIALGVGGATALDTRMRRTAAATLTLDNNSTGAVTVVPATDNQNILGTAALRWSTINAVTANFVLAASDANPAVRVDNAGAYLGAGGAGALDLRLRRTAASTLTIDNNSTGAATIVPATTNTGVIGTDALKWNRIRATSVVTGDLEMKDEAKGVHYVLQEEKDGIYVRDMVKRKMYKIPMVEVPWRE